jgi:hypothetical protein
VRTDKNLRNEIRDQPAWQEQTHAAAIEDPINQSFSGEELNRWFHNRPKQSETGQRDLIEQSMLSGLDSIADGRAFAIGDFNRDGRPDIALCNANAPVLQLFENQIESDNNFVALRFEGAARSESKPDGQSCRDGYGAVVRLTLDDGLSIVREFRCGEGFAAQNSDTLLIGIGEAKTVEEITVSWPSGTKQVLGPIESGLLQTVAEQKGQSLSAPESYTD